MMADGSVITRKREGATPFPLFTFLRMRRAYFSRVIVFVSLNAPETRRYR